MCVCVCVSHSVMSDSLWPHGLQSARLLCPWNSPGKNPAVGCISFSNANCSGSSVVAKSHLTLATPQTVACQVLLSMGFSRQEYWSELPFSSPGDFPTARIDPASLMSSALSSVFFTTSATWEAQISHIKENSDKYYMQICICITLCVIKIEIGFMFNIY